MVDFYHIVEDLEQWTDGKGIILSGAGGTFCSGGDLDVVRQIANPESGFKMASLMHYTLNKLKNLPLISVCFISGAGNFANYYHSSSVFTKEIVHIMYKFQK